MIDRKIPLCPTRGASCVLSEENDELRDEVSRLSELVSTDTLTGLFNFRYFSDTLSLEMERTSRSGVTTALIMLDLDYFKRVNDRWGHEVGNRALILTAQLLDGCTRKLDVCCRYGGEEFAIILPSTDLVTGVQVAERVRKKISAVPLLVDGDDIGLTASLGVATYTNYQSETVEQFVGRADERLYEAKKTGRNKVCHEDLSIEKSETSISVDEKIVLSGLFSD